jgi:general secretion pathway protein D
MLDEEEEDRQQGDAAEPPLSSRYASKKEFYFEGESVVIPDTNLNSIILIAPEYIHEEVDAVLKTLDVRRPQVLFEVAILDIAQDDTIEFGVEVASINRQGADNIRGHGFSNFGVGRRESSVGAGFPDVTEVPTDVAGLFVGITRGEIGNVPLLIRMLQENTSVNVRSTPLLLVNDNEEAIFSSLLEEPTTTTSQGTATTNVSFAGFVEAGTVLTITPHVSEGNYIRVDVDLKVDNFRGDPAAPGIPPSRATNQLTTAITVPDKRTVVIGGLTETKRVSVVSGVPILSQIPLLGLLFSNTSEQEVTSRLFLFIRPHILDDVEFDDLNEISAAKSLEVQGITGETIVSEDEAAEAAKAIEERAARRRIPLPGEQPRTEGEPPAEKNEAAPPEGEGGKTDTKTKTETEPGETVPPAKRRTVAQAGEQKEES